MEKIQKTVSFLDIWNGPLLIYMRGKIATGRYREIPLCSQCDILWKEQVLGIPVKSIKELRYFLTGARMYSGINSDLIWCYNNCAIRNSSEEYRRDALGGGRKVQNRGIKAANGKIIFKVFDFLLT